MADSTTFVLIVMVIVGSPYGGRPALTAAEFTSVERCEAAAAAFTKRTHELGKTRNVVAICAAR